MYNKLKAILIMLLIILLGIIFTNTAINHPEETRDTFIVVGTIGGGYWLYRLVLSILEDK